MTFIGFRESARGRLEQMKRPINHGQRWEFPNRPGDPVVPLLGKVFRRGAALDRL